MTVTIAAAISSRSGAMSSGKPMYFQLPEKTDSPMPALSTAAGWACHTTYAAAGSAVVSRSKKNARPGETR